MKSNLRFIVAILLLSCNGRKTPPAVETDAVQPVTAVQCPADPVFGGVRMKTAKVTFPDAPGTPSLTVEVAATDRERARGLMYRTQMAPNAGMLFLPDGPPRVQRFWMKNTCIPLDMIFISESGKIVGILENVPPMNLKQRAVKARSSYVLETNAGWTSRAGIKSGQQVTLP